MSLKNASTAPHMEIVQTNAPHWQILASSAFYRAACDALDV